MALSGDVATLSLADLLQVSAATRRTCRIIVQGSACTGVLTMERGELTAARFGSLAALEAVYAALQDSSLRFELEFARGSVPRTINVSLEHILLESARRQDESNRPVTPLAVPVTTPSAVRNRRPYWMLASMAVLIPGTYWLSGLGGRRAERYVAPTAAATTAVGASRRETIAAVPPAVTRPPAVPVHVAFLGHSLTLTTQARAQLRVAAGEALAREGHLVIVSRSSVGDGLAQARAKRVAQFLRWYVGRAGLEVQETSIGPTNADPQVDVFVR